MTVTLKPLAQQVIVVTGASSGIGLVTAKEAARRGARVLMVARSADALAKAVDDIRAAGGTAEYKVADVGDAGQVKAAVAFAVERFGRIDTWINDAGVAIYAKLLETPIEEHERLFRTNYFGVVNSANAVIPELNKNGGAFITVGSIASDIPSPIMGAYAASKHAIKAYIHALRMELRADDKAVSVTLIKPAGIDTPIGQHAMNHEGGEAQIPPPVYHPQLVAETILDAAVRPRRDITVGGAGRAQVLFAEHFPGLFEWLAPKQAAGFVDQSKEQPQPSNLFQGANAGREQSGEYTPKTFSLYTTAARHPKTTTVASVGLLAGALTLLFANGSKGERDG